MVTVFRVKAEGLAIAATLLDSGPESYFRRWALYHARKGTRMEQGFSHKSIAILQELDLGRYTLFIMSDGGIDLLANDEQMPYLADNGICLDSDEAYRLLVSLQEQFKHKGE
jgi:hypothetical protein